MLFSQFALIVLIVLAMITGYIPWVLGLAALVGWGAAKLVMRSVIGQVERRALETTRLSGSRLRMHSVETLDPAPGGEPRYGLDVTVEPPHPTTEWYPTRLDVFDHQPEHPRACVIEDCQIWTGDSFISHISEPVRGSGRVRLLVRTPTDTSSVVLSHGEERLGAVTLQSS